MRIIEDVDLPSDVITAQRDGRLVIFAGAGVSMGPPANYPSFSDLAWDVAQRAGNIVTREVGEPEDRFLGRIVDTGAHVHELIRSILSNPGSQPTPLHEVVVQIFPLLHQLRIVTTNFDPHFSTVVEAHLSTQLPTYFAPALPLGNRFTGLVYLHGSVRQDAHELIVTDRDFGRAYLTEGWARRFLQALFAEFTVLFVGYSHEDPIMRYLARGLPPKTKRFALYQDAGSSNWSQLGIVGIPYPPSPPPDTHRALLTTLCAWRDLIQMGYTEHENRIEQLVAASPPIDQENIDYISERLRDPDSAVIFKRHAKSIEWLRWVAENGFLDALFTLGDPLDEGTRILANWFADTFVAQGDAAIAVVQRKGQLLHSEMWWAIGRRVWGTLGDPGVRGLDRWLGLLLKTAPNDGSGADLLESILGDCKYPQDKTVAVLLFEYLTRPHINLEPTFYSKDEDSSDAPLVRYSVRLTTDAHGLQEAWDNFFRPNLSSFAAQLWPIVTAHLQQAYDLLNASGSASEIWDPVSFGRSAIEPHPQDKQPEAVDLLIDAARDIVETLVSVSDHRADALIDMWAGSEAPILRRLAVHGLDRSNKNANAKLLWLLKRGWLYLHPVKHEVFQLLQTAYPSAALHVQRRVLRAAERGPRLKSRSKKHRRSRSYEIYNLLLWLAQAAPGSTLTRQRFANVQAEHPDFRPRSNPDFDTWMEGGWVGHRPPVTAAEILKKSPEEQVDFFLEYRPQTLMEGGREDLLLEIERAIADSDTWGWALVNVLIRRDVDEVDLWRAIFRGWRQSSLTAAHVQTVVDFLLTHPTHAALVSDVADLLEGIGKDASTRLPESTLGSLKQLARRVWDILEQVPEQDGVISDDWLLRAFNQPSGDVLFFWLHVLSAERERRRSSWTGLPEADKQFLDQVIAGTSEAATLGRVVMASQLHFLYSLDQAWTRERVLPLLDWRIDSERAVQAWHGFLTSGNLFPALVAELLPLYESGFGHGYRALGERRNRFVEHLAYISTYLPSHPLASGWLLRFIGGAEPADRRAWAQHVGHFLSNLSDERKSQVWQEWLSDYWEQRLKGVPAPLDSGEGGAMLSWALSLSESFPAAVAMVVRGPAPHLEHTLAYRRLKESDVNDRFPADSALLLKFLLRHQPRPFWWCGDIADLVSRYVVLGVRPDLIAPIREHARRLDCSSL